MAHERKTLTALAALLPAGTLGLSVSLAAAGAKAATTTDPAANKPGAVAEKLQSIREDVAGAIDEQRQEGHKFLKVDPEQRLAWWGNGWHNGWGNGGWHNWGNGWHNWGNGWHNWGNGWHNW